MAGYEEHTFWCIKCGKQGIPVQRKVNHKYGKHHRKNCGVLLVRWKLTILNAVMIKK